MQTYDRHWTCSMYVVPSGLSSFTYPCYHLQLSVSIRILKQTQESERNRHVETEALLAAMQRGRKPTSSNALMLTGITEEVTSSPPQSPQSGSMEVGGNPPPSQVSPESSLASCSSTEDNLADVRRTASCCNSVFAPGPEYLWSGPRHREFTPTYAPCSSYHPGCWHSRHTPNKTSGYARGHKVTSTCTWASHRTRPRTTELCCCYSKTPSCAQKIQLREGWEGHFQSTALWNYR